MSVNIKKFIDIDIKPKLNITISGTRNTVVLFTPDNTDGLAKTITSFSDAKLKYGSSELTLAYLKVFFDNGGVAVHVIENKAYSAVTVEDIRALTDDKILVAFAVESSQESAAYTAIKALADKRNADATIYGVNEKILLARVTETNEDIVKNLAVKYSKVVGAEMTMAAYLTQINVYKINSVRDYMFTAENIKSEVIDDAKYDTITLNNINVDIVLSNTVRNCGGNCKDGQDLVNNFVRIILHQTLSERLLNLLLQKIKSVDGLGKIYSVISEELNNYLLNGYLTTDKFWDKDTLTVTYDNGEYTIIEKGTPLLNGFYVKILPLSAVTANRSTPPIYVVLADQYGIRKITINGEVI